MKKNIIFFVLVFMFAVVIAFVLGKKNIIGKAIVKVGVDLSAKKPKNVPLHEIEDRIVIAMRTLDKGNFTKNDVDSLDNIVYTIMNNKMDSTKFMNLLIKADQYFDTTNHNEKTSEEK